MDASPFPLALTPFEHYMLADDTVDHPMTVALRCYYSGTIDHQRLIEAAKLALQAHPLLSARIQGDLTLPTRRIFWQHVPAQPQLLCLKGGDAKSFPRRLNLYEESGLRLILLEEGPSPCLLVQWHHACCDGVGILHFLETLLHAYRDGHAIGDRLQQQVARSQQWWQARSRLQTRWYHDLKRSPRDLARIVDYFRTSTIPLAADNVVQKPAPSFWSNDEYCAVTLTPPETSALQTSAKQQQVSLNDFLLAKYFRVLLAWNLERQQQRSTQSLRVAVPINLRSANAPRLDPAVNGVSMVFLDRDRRQIESDQLLPGIVREMNNVKRWQTGWALIQSLAAAGWFRHGMIRLVSTGSPRITSGLSNLGRILAHSDLANATGKLQADTWTLERVEPFPPVRPGVAAAVDVLTYANQLTLTINYDRLQLTQSSAHALLNQFASHLSHRDS